MDTYQVLVSEFNILKKVSTKTTMSKEEADKLNNIIAEKLKFLETAISKNDLKTINELTITIRILLDGFKTMV